MENSGVSEWMVWFTGFQGKRKRKETRLRQEEQSENEFLVDDVKPDEKTLLQTLAAKE